MYKVFFNDRTIYLDDNLPDMAEVGKDYVCAFENITDLKPQLKQFLLPEKEGNLYIFHDDLESLFNTFSKCFITIEAGGGLLTNDKGEVMVIFRRGKWDLPKGKREDGETIEQCAVREVEEECGIKEVELKDFLLSTYHIYEDAGKLCLKKTSWYTMFYQGDSNPHPNVKEDITEARWINPSDLEKIHNNTFLSIIDVLKAGNL